MSQNAVPDALAAAGYAFRFQTIDAALWDLLDRSEPA
jgi:NAD dependent epimerase/dehydratase family enzyme